MFKESGIVHETGCLYTSQQNDIVERKHRHLLEIACALKIECGMPSQYWGECILTACYLINLFPTVVLDGLSPYEKLTDKSPMITHLKVFGCICFAKVLNSSNKFQSRSVPYVFMGNCLTQKGYKLLNLDTKTFFISRCSV